MFSKFFNVKKKAVQMAGLDPKTERRVSNTIGQAKATIRGISGDNLLEPIPEFIETPSEKVISNTNNSWIVLGRDRPSSRASGYGGKGDTQAASIDIVCGRMAHLARSVDKKTGERVWTDPDFKVDAARIYISQKTDLDKNFGLVNGVVGTSDAKSGIGLKADAIRLVAREGIKLVSSVSRKNSQGGDLVGFSGIDLIAGNINDASKGTDLQPIPKGDNLAEAMRRMADHLAKLNGVVTTMLMTQNKFNAALMNHWHHSPFFAAPTVPSVVLMPEGVKCLVDSLTKAGHSLAANKINIGSVKQTFLKQHGKRYICSRYNNVN